MTKEKAQFKIGKSKKKQSKPNGNEKNCDCQCILFDRNLSVLFNPKPNVNVNQTGF